MNTRSVFAVLLIILGVGFLLSQLNVWNFSHIIGRWWPLTLVIVGVIKITSDRHSIFWGFLIFAFGLLLLADNLKLLPWGNFWDYFWPLLLIAAGLSLISGKRRIGNRGSKELNIIKEFVIFGGSEQIIESSDFKGGNITALMGGSTINLTNAVIISDYVELDLMAVMGGIEIIIPENWKIEVSGTPILGGMENKTRYVFNEDITTILRIRYTAIMGGIEIRN